MAEDESWQDPKSPQDARLASLDERLARAQAEEAERTGGPRAPRWAAPLTGKSEGGRILSVLLGYPLGSAVIGYAIDRLAGTGWVVLVMLFLGFGAAMREVWKISQRPPK
jgi:ATP synthase protein I